MKIGAKSGLVAVAILGATAPRAEAQQNISNCVVGMRVITKGGLHGTISRLERYYCFVRYDDGKEGMEFVYTLFPESMAMPKLGAPPADGEYNCIVSYGGFSHPSIVPMGNMDIRGATYRFRPFGKVTQGWASFSIETDGALRWGGKMGGLDSPPSMITGSKKLPDGRFTIDYKVKPGSLIDSMVCSKV